jgi:hypothetical protein
MDITEDDFNAWKHHPVTKIYLRYVLDHEQEMMVQLLEILRSAETTAPDPFVLGTFKGRSIAQREMAGLEFGHIASFYAPPEQEEKED